ncbi:MAG TPA: Uma2 family endonuclease [Thermoanaerobaculia bacterium]|nr:Uma2 family endonuclease [Thermoanaerobaculia bacterium]
MAPQTATRMTYEEFMALPAENVKHYELVEGELYVNPAPNIRHQIIAGNVYFALRSYLKEHRVAQAAMSPIDVVLSPEIVLQPDVSVWFDRIGQWKKAYRAPEIAVEVLSEGSQRHDKVTKRRLYERFGVKDYWIVDAEAETVTIVRAGEEIVVREFITTPLLPGFSLPLRDVFSEEP